MNATAAAIRAQLTGPGGQFEVTRETIDGVEVKVYASRFGELRTVAQFATAHGAKTFIVYGDREITFAEFLSLSNSVSRHLRDDAGVAHGDRVAVLSQNNPEWCLSFWGAVTRSGRQVHQT